MTEAKQRFIVEVERFSPEQGEDALDAITDALTDTGMVAYIYEIDSHGNPVG